MRNGGTGRQQWDLGPHIPVRVAADTQTQRSPIEELIQAAPRPRRKKSPTPASATASVREAPNRWLVAALVMVIPAGACCFLPWGYIPPPAPPDPNRPIRLPVRESVIEGPQWSRSYPPDRRAPAQPAEPEPPVQSVYPDLLRYSVLAYVLACVGLVAFGFYALATCRVGWLAAGFVAAMIAAVANVLLGMLARSDGLVPLGAAILMRATSTYWPLAGAIVGLLGLCLSAASASVRGTDPCSR